MRAPAGKQIIQMLLDGELDAVLGEKVERQGVTPLFADVAAEEKAWFAKHRVMPINHMVVVSTTLSNRRPDAVREVFRLLQQSAARAGVDRPVVQHGGNEPFAGTDQPICRAAGTYSARRSPSTNCSTT